LLRPAPIGYVTSEIEFLGGDALEHDQANERRHVEALWCDEQAHEPIGKI
jgi:hypothetical protein